MSDLFWSRDPLVSDLFWSRDLLVSDLSQVHEGYLATDAEFLALGLRDGACLVTALVRDFASNATLFLERLYNFPSPSPPRVCPTARTRTS